MNILAAESANPLIPPVGEIIVGTITFAILAFVMIKFVVPRANTGSPAVAAPLRAVTVTHGSVASRTSSSSPACL